MFVVVDFDALAQASDIQIERRQVVFRCWKQDLNPRPQTPIRQWIECSLTNRLCYQRSSLKTWTRQPVPMISEHSAHLVPLSVDFRTWLWRYTCLLLLISMLWHRQAIFKSKGDKLCSSAESRIWSRDPRHQFASRLNASWQTDWAIENQAKNLHRQPIPLISEHSAHLVPLSVDFRTWLWRYTCLLLLISMLWHRQAIFKLKGYKLCFSAESRIWTQDPRHQFAGRLNAHWQTDWAIVDQAKKLDLDSPSLWSASIQPTWSHCQLTFAPGSGDIHVCCCWFRCPGTGKRYSNRKETSCVPLLNAGFEPETPDTNSPADGMLADKPTELSRIKLKKMNSTASPYDQRALSPLGPTVSWLSHLALAIYMFYCCWFRCSGTGKRYSNRKETSCVPLLKAGFEPDTPDTNSPADWMLADKPTELSRIKPTNLNSTARPYDQRAFSPIGNTVSWISHLALAIYMFVVVDFDVLAQASDIQIERRQVVFLCWKQVLNPRPETPIRQQTECSLTNRLSYRGSS